MLRLKELYFNNIGRFIEEQRVNFESLGNLIQVDGNNQNTGGSSGSGKTTIFNSLDYLLGLNDLPTTVLQSRLAKESMIVGGIFDWDGKVLEIIRSKKGLKIVVDGEQKDNGSKISEELLDQILGMPRSLFRKMMHKRQKEGGFFLDFTPKQMNEFLQDCIGLSEYKNKNSIIDNKIKELELSKAQKSNKLESVRSSLKATQDAISALGILPKEEINQSMVLELKNSYDSSISQFKKIEEKHKLELSQLYDKHSKENQELEKERPEVEVLPYDRSKLNSYEQQKRSLESKLNSMVLEEKDRQMKIKSLIAAKNLELNKLNYQIINGNTAKQKAVELALQIKKIRDSICPTCNQGWVAESAKTKEAELLNELSIHKEAIATATVAKENLDKLTIEIQALDFQSIPIDNPEVGLINSQIIEISYLIKEEEKDINEYNRTQNESNRLVMESFSTKQKFLRIRQDSENSSLVISHKNEMDQIRGQVDINRRSLDIAVQKMKSYEEIKARYFNTLQKLNINKDNFEVEIKDLELQLNLTEKELTKAGELHKIMKSFVSCSFDNALEIIGDTATRIIRNIPNMANATIQLEGLKETKEGKIKEEVNAVISTDGESEIPIKSFSGGERNAIDLAVDLSVIDFIKDISGKGINLYIMDEPCSSLDAINIEQIIEIIKNYNKDRKLIIVEHNPIVKEMIADKILVIREIDSSRILQ